MAAGNTYTQIASTTLGSTANTVTFSSIAATYTDLVLVINAQCQTSSGQGLYLQYNSDTATNYSSTVLYGNGSSALSTRTSSVVKAGIGNIDTSNYGTTIVNIQNYSNATTYKTAISRSNAPANYVLSYVSLWRATAAINSLTILLDTAPFNSGSTFNLYGITSA